MSTKLGKPKHIEKITLKDCLDNPIWVSTYDEESFDEEYQQPVLSSTANVTQEILKTHVTPIIACKVDGHDLYATGNYDHDEGTLYAIALWMKKKWQTIEDVKGLKTPLTFTALPKLLGRESVKFVLKSAKDPIAKRLA